MPFDPDKAGLSPIAAHVYRLALEYDSITHPLNCAFVAEMDVQHGYGTEVLAEIYQIVNQRRAEKGLPPLPTYLDDTGDDQ